MPIPAQYAIGPDGVIRDVKADPDLFELGDAKAASRIRERAERPVVRRLASLSSSAWTCWSGVAGAASAAAFSGPASAVSAAVVENSKLIPVWLVDEKSVGQEIMVAVDGSQNSLRAVDHLAR